MLLHWCRASAVRAIGLRVMAFEVKSIFLLAWSTDHGQVTDFSEVHFFSSLNGILIAPERLPVAYGIPFSPFSLLTKLWFYSSCDVHRRLHSQPLLQLLVANEKKLLGEISGKYPWKTLIQLGWKQIFPSFSFFLRGTQALWLELQQPFWVKNWSWGWSHKIRMKQHKTSGNVKCW